MGRDGRRWKQWDTGQSQIPAAYPLPNIAKLKFHSLVVTAVFTLFLPPWGRGAVGHLCMLQKSFRLQFAAEPDSIVTDTIKTPVFFMFPCCVERCLQGRVMCSEPGNGRSRCTGHTVLEVSPLTSEKRLTCSRGFHGLREAARTQVTHFPWGMRVWGVADGLM